MVETEVIDEIETKTTAHVVSLMEYLVDCGNKLGVHEMQQASRKAEPGDYKHAVNDM